jgi:lipoprotein NlpI
VCSSDLSIRLSPNEVEGFSGRGKSYARKGDHDRAIADLTEALRLEPDNFSDFLWRGTSYFVKKDYDRSIADYTESNRLVQKFSPGSSDGLSQRATAYTAKGDYDRAIADYTAVMAKDGETDYKKEVTYIFSKRGRVNLFAANYGAAASDFGRYLQGHPDDADSALWLYLARARSGKQTAREELEANAAKLKQPDWPYPVVEFFLGRRELGATLAAAGKPNERCQAQFYIGEWHLLSHPGRAEAAPQRPPGVLGGRV